MNPDSVSLLKIGPSAAEPNSKKNQLLHLPVLVSYTAMFKGQIMFSSFQLLREPH